jgi:hypothetical protein
MFAFFEDWWRRFWFENYAFRGNYWNKLLHSLVAFEQEKDYCVDERKWFPWKFLLLFVHFEISLPTGLPDKKWSPHGSLIKLIRFRKDLLEPAWSLILLFKQLPISFTIFITNYHPLLARPQSLFEPCTPIKSFLLWKLQYFRYFRLNLPLTSTNFLFL